MIDLLEFKAKAAKYFHLCMIEVQPQDVVEICERAIAAEAKLAEIEKQEPYCYLAKGIGAVSSDKRLGYDFPLYAHPVQQSPVVNLRAIDTMSDDDIWHIATLVSSMSGGSVFNLSADECILKVRASFEDPDTAREMMSQTGKNESRRIGDIHIGGEILPEFKSDCCIYCGLNQGGGSYHLDGCPRLGEGE